MKKTIILLIIALLSVIFYCQTITNLFAFHKQINIEYVMDNFVQIEDHCEEDEFENTGNTFIRTTLKEFISPTLPPGRIFGILSFIWQPPK
jgi:hypothetical protein